MNIKTIAILSGIASDIDDIEGNAELYKATNFNSRADAIDFLDFHIIDRIEGLLQNGAPRERLYLLQQHAEKVKQQLEKIDADLFEQLRENIRTGVYTGSSFREMIGKYLGSGIRPGPPTSPASPVSDIGQPDAPDNSGYDNLDIFINGLLSGRPMPEATKEPTPEMVFYQKTPVRVVFELTEMAQLQKDDVFIDIGSGLGQVAILVNLISGARARGIEYESAYCDYAKTCTSQLNLPNVEFIDSDALNGNYAEGTVFFLYTPFEGRLLQDMLEILYKESRKRMIRVFTYGPCSPQIARQPWLHCVNGGADNFYRLYQFSTRPMTNSRRQPGDILE
jgi:hypothetical protein